MGSQAKKLPFTNWRADRFIWKPSGKNSQFGKKEFGKVPNLAKQWVVVLDVAHIGWGVVAWQGRRSRKLPTGTIREKLLNSNPWYS